MLFKIYNCVKNISLETNNNNRLQLKPWTFMITSCFNPALRLEKDLLE